MTTMNLTERITVNPNQCGGRPCIRGMRIRVIDVLELQAAGLIQVNHNWFTSDCVMLSVAKHLYG